MKTQLEIKNLKIGELECSFISIQNKLAEAYKKLQELGDTFDHIPDFVQKVPLVIRNSWQKNTDLCLKERHHNSFKGWFVHT